MNHQALIGVDLPIIQAPMAGVQGAALAAAVSRAGGLGSLPTAVLTVEALRDELATLARENCGPVNLNFFCHAPPSADSQRELAWRVALQPYFAEFGLSIERVSPGAGRSPFTAEACEVLE